MSGLKLQRLVTVPASAVVRSVAAATLSISIYCGSHVAPTRVIAFKPVGAPAESRYAEFALSPNGRDLVAVRKTGRHQALWIRPLSSLEGRQIRGTDGASYPFWSPDGRTLAFFAGGKLKRIERSGDGLRTLADAPNPRGGSWGGAGQSFIVFAPSNVGPLVVIAGSGGFLEAATTLSGVRKETSHEWPHFLRDGRHYVYLAKTTSGQGVLMSAALGQREATVVAEADSGAVFADLQSGASNNQLLFVRKGWLTAQPFDGFAARVTGAASRVDLQVRVDASNYPYLSTAGGVMAYASPTARGDTTLALVSRRGDVVRTVEAQSDFQAQYMDARLSPDSQRIAVTGATSTSRAVWVYDLKRRTRTRISDDGVDALAPVWSPDGSRLAWGSSHDKRGSIMIAPSNGGEKADTVLSDDAAEFLPMDWSRDGKFVLFLAAGAWGSEISVVPMIGERTRRTILRVPSLSLGMARFSPSGRWISYVSSESGRPEVYIIATSGTQGPQRVSTLGGKRAIWRGDGRELFYVSAEEQIIAVRVRERETAVEIVDQHPLFGATVAGIGDSTFDVARDGSQFLLISAGEMNPYTLFTTSLISEAKRFGWLPLPQVQ